MKSSSASKPELEIYISGGADLRSKMLMVWKLVCKGINAGPVIVKLCRPKRSNAQNARLWASLNDIATQVEWGGETLSNEEWKHVFTAALHKQKVVRGIDGGLVVLATRTRDMNKEEFSQLLELIYAFGAQHQVKWSDPALKFYENMGIIH